MINQLTPLQERLNDIDLVELITNETGLHYNTGKIISKGNATKNQVQGGCPFCDRETGDPGTNRFAVFINDDPVPHYKCGIHNGNGCKKWGDAITFIQEWRGVTFVEACAYLEIPFGGSSTRVAVRKPTPETFDMLPEEEWTRTASEFVEIAQLCLHSERGTPALEYLHQRGLTDYTIERARLGYNPQDVFTQRAAWGLEERGGKKLWLPAGIIIPWYVFDCLWAIKVRRTNSAIKKSPEFGKYIQIEGGSNGLYQVDGIVDGSPLFLVEGELDALVGIQETGHSWVAVGGVSKLIQMRKQWVVRMAHASSILYVCDNDSAGVQAIESISNQEMVVWPPVTSDGIKDVTDMKIQGVDISAWAQSGIEFVEMLTASVEHVEPVLANVVEDEKFRTQYGEVHQITIDQLQLITCDLRVHPHPMGLDVETTTVSYRSGKMVALQTGTKEDAYVLDMRPFHAASCDEQQRWVSILCEFIDAVPLFVGHNLCFDLQFMYHLTGKRITRVIDTMIQEQVLNGTRSGGDGGEDEEDKKFNPKTALSLKAVSQRAGFEVSKEEQIWFAHLDEPRRLYENGVYCHVVQKNGKEENYFHLDGTACPAKIDGKDNPERPQRYKKGVKGAPDALATLVVCEDYDLWSKPYPDAQVAYMGQDVFLPMRIVELQEEELKRERLSAVAQLENELVPVVASIEYSGMPVDTTTWKEIIAMKLHGYVDEQGGFVPGKDQLAAYLLTEEAGLVAAYKKHFEYMEECAEGAEQRYAEYMSERSVYENEYAAWDQGRLQAEDEYVGANRTLFSDMVDADVEKRLREKARKTWTKSHKSPKKPRLFHFTEQEKEALLRLRTTIDAEYMSKNSFFLIALHEMGAKVAQVKWDKKKQQEAVDPFGEPVLAPARPPKGGDATMMAKENLYLLRIDFPIVEHIIAFNTVSFYLSGFGENKLEYVDNGRLYPRWNQIGAETGRFSTSSPSMQNIPSHEPEVTSVRRAVVAPEGCIILDADYSQNEQRILAEWSHDDAMIQLYQEGKDFYSNTANRMYGLKPLSQEEIETLAKSDKKVRKMYYDDKKEAYDITARIMKRDGRAYRDLAKTTTLAVNYGQGPISLAYNLQVTEEEASDALNRYEESYPQATAWSAERAAHMMDNPVWFRGEKYTATRTMLGRRRLLSSLEAKPTWDKADEAVSRRRLGKWWGDKGRLERQCKNAPIQGSGSDFLKRALVLLYEALPEDCLIIACIHDEVLLQVPIEKQELAQGILQQCMEKAAKEFLKIVPVGEVDAMVSTFWKKE